MLSVISRLGLADFGGQFLLRGDDRLDGLMGEFQRGIEVVVGNLLGGAFIHHQVGFIADINQVQIALQTSRRAWDWR